MKKIMSLLTVMAMLSNIALAGPANDSLNAHAQLIAKTFNQFRYKMTVEVNPNDANFQKLAVSDFKQKMINLQSQGVEPAEIMNYMRTTILDSATLKDFDRLMASVDANKISAEEAGNLAMQFMASRYQSGASYSGGQGSYGWIAAVIGIVIVGVVTYYVTINNMPTKTSTVTNTVTESCTHTNTETNTIVRVGDAVN